MKIVLLPGLDGTGMLFKPFIESLPSDCEPLILSYPLNKKMSYKALAAFVMEQLPVNEDYILVAESFSGPVAYDIALHKPVNLKSVIFVASFLSNPRPFILKMFSLFPLGFLLLFPIPKFIIKLFLLGAGASESLIYLFKENIKKVPAKILTYRLSEIAKLPNEHQPCSMRAIYIQATNDKLVPSNCVDLYKRAMENLRVVHVEGPHFLLQANPVKCAEIIIGEDHSEVF